jgi:hypothetical protein
LIKANVTEESVLGPVLYLLCFNDVPATLNSTTATFADDTAVKIAGETVGNSTRKLKSTVNRVAIWTKNWQIKLNESKSVHIDFADKKIRQQPVFINGTQVPNANTAKYRGMTLDAKLQWKDHCKKNVMSSTSGSRKYIVAWMQF